MSCSVLSQSLAYKTHNAEERDVDITVSRDISTTAGNGHLCPRGVQLRRRHKRYNSFEDNCSYWQIILSIDFNNCDKNLSYALTISVKLILECLQTY